ncbi:MAG: hypothetical protein LBR13_04930, partial [Dysgonamonadaceae bacterium]|nr:hypothetical protein [Dysgonamonadaceae bacterium]
MSKKFSCRHIGINKTDGQKMLAATGVADIEQLICETIPENIRLKKPLDLPEAMTEREFSEHIEELA